MTVDPALIDDGTSRIDGDGGIPATDAVKVAVGLHAERVGDGDGDRVVTRQGVAVGRDGQGACGPDRNTSRSCRRPS